MNQENVAIYNTENQDHLFFLAILVQGACFWTNETAFLEM